MTFASALRSSAGRVPVADILQVWLDVGSQSARGHEQAEEIRDLVLTPIIGEER